MLCIHRCCVFHMGFAQETDFSCVRTASHGTSCAFTVLILSAGKERSIGLCPTVESSSYYYAARSSARGGPDDHLNGRTPNWGFQDGGLRIHLSTFEEAVNVALNAEFNFTPAQYDNQWNASSSFGKDEPMDLSHDREEDKLQDAEKQRNIRRCYMCGSNKHLRLNCPLQKQRQLRPNQASS